MLRNCCPWKMNQEGIHDVTKIKMCLWRKQFRIHRPTFPISLHANTSVVKSLVHLSHPIFPSILWPPGLFSGASHIHKATCCSLGVSFMDGTLFSLSSLAFPALQHQHQLYKISSCTRAVAQSLGAASDDLQLLSLLSNPCSLPLIPPSVKHSGVLPGSALSQTALLGATRAPFWRRRLPAKRLQLLSCICMNKQLWRVQLKLLCKHSPKYVLHCIIPSNKDSGIRIWLSVLLMLHGVQ